MISPELRKQYKVTIGIECHVQLKTVSKLFSSVGNDAREAPPNSLVSHIDCGLPGALPVLNREAVRLAIRAGFALGTEAQHFSKFDRKHYFYPDLPKGYQITQFDQPVILGGSITVNVEGGPKTIGITRAHLEEDAGKSTHPTGKDYSLVDLNRAGTPLLEIVSEPDMHTAAEAKAYARELYLRMKYADVSEANLYYGNMRFDVNVSVSKISAGAGKLGTRTETKNLNSFRSVEKSVEYEVTRQIELLEKGEAILQETRGWDDAKQKTFSQRTKEDAHDYRYFPDPDLPPVVIDPKEIAAIKATMPIMPDVWRERLSGLDLDSAQIETLLEGEIDNDSIGYLGNIESHLDKPDVAKFLANWYVNVAIPLVRDGKFKLGDNDHIRLEITIYGMVKSNQLSSTNAKLLFEDVAVQDKLPEDIAAYAEEKGYIQESNEDAIIAIVDQVLADNPKAADDVKAGEMKAIGFLTGQVMKQSQGKANPQLAQSLIRRQLRL
jgi:aspartyl-tRNA(Asn)/glutamyl-tRNA(Gln) amidotransferase subunit B